MTLTAASYWIPDAPLLVASRSRARLDMLAKVGLRVEGQPSTVDERAVEAGLGTATPRKTAIALARAKALDVAKHHPERFVLGADQTLALGDELLHKPADRAEAEQHLKRLSGQSHHLSSAAVLVQGNRIVFEVVGTARLRMRQLDDEAIGRYLDSVPDDVYLSVGCYQIEGLGPLLFEGVKGDLFTILGLPLIPLLDGLRREGLIQP